MARARAVSRILAFDIGGSFLKAALIDAKGRLLTERLKVPALKYVAPGRTARDLLLKDLTLERFRIADRALKPRYLVQSFVNTAESLSAVRDRTHRLHFKSLSAILALQDDIQAHWSNRQSAPAAGEKLAGGVCPGASDGVSFSAEAHPT